MSNSILPGLGMDALAQTKMMEQRKELEQLQAQARGAQAGEAKKAATPQEEEAAQMFEGLLLKQMLTSMWKTVPEGGLMSGSREEGMYRDMLNDAYSEDLSSGQGIGIKELILEEFKRR